MWSTSEVDVSAYNCLNLLYALLAHSKQFAYQMLAKGSWSFSFQRNANQPVGECFSCKTKNDVEIALEKYHGLKVYKHEFNGPTIEWKMMANDLLLERNAIIVNTDSYWCPWSRAYREQHYMHSFLISGFNGNLAICEDPYLQVSSQNIDIALLLPGIRHVSFIEKVHTELCTNDELIRGLNNDMEEIVSSCMFEEMDLFVQTIRNINFGMECQGYHWKQAYAIPLFANMKDLMMSRRGYAYMIAYIAQKMADDVLGALAEKLYMISVDWEEVRSRLIWLAMRQRNQGLPTVVDDMSALVSKEKNLVCTILRGLGSKYLRMV